MNHAQYVVRYDPSPITRRKATQGQVCGTARKLFFGPVAFASNGELLYACDTIEIERQRFGAVPGPRTRKFYNDTDAVSFESGSFFSGPAAFCLPTGPGKRLLSLNHSCVVWRLVVSSAINLHGRIQQ